LRLVADIQTRWTHGSLRSFAKSNFKSKSKSNFKSTKHKSPGCMTPPNGVVEHAASLEMKGDQEKSDHANRSSNRATATRSHAPRTIGLMTWVAQLPSLPLP
jgi:hypothetical protein